MLIRLFLILMSVLFSALLHAEEPLEPGQAFRFSARAVDANTLEARWQIADDYYLYRDKFKFSLEGGKLGSIKLPAGKLKDDELFGKVETYRKEIKVLVPVSGGTSATLTLKVVYQGCWDGGICYPPITETAVLKLPPPALAAAIASPPDASQAPVSGVESAPAPALAPSAVSPAPTLASTSAPSSTSAPVVAESETSRIAALFTGKNLGLILVSFFGFGLLLSLTPCVFPMIPILSGIIVNHGHAVTHGRAFVLSLAYVLGMAITYAAIGVAAGLSGTLLSAALQNVWVLGAFALVFVILALSMFGFYELQLPAALQSRLSTTANKTGGSLPAIVLMGALSALIVGPCVAAPLAGALLYIAQTGNATLGGMALFAMALGMGAPLLLVGAFSRTLLPKSGPWMEGVKKVFGVIMLATALWLVLPVIPVWVGMLGWALLLIVPGIFLHALDSLPISAHGMQRLGKAAGVVMLISGAAMLVGVLGGARDPLQPLGFLRSTNATSATSATTIAVSPAPSFQRVHSVAELDTVLARADRPVMLDFYADWCVSCKEMERFTFADPQVASAMGHMILLKADVTANSDNDKALLKRFGLFGPPGILFFKAAQEAAEQRVIGYMPAEKFLTVLDVVRITN